MANFTRKAILAEFEKMLTEMPFSKITVTALVARTEISSNTFYYHFHDIYGLIDAWIEEKFKAFTEKTKDLDNLADIMKRFFTDMKEHPALVYHISDSVTRELLERYIMMQVKEAFREYVKEKTFSYIVDQNQLEAMTDIFCYSFVGLTLEFIWHRMDMDIDAHCDNVYGMYHRLVSTFEPDNQDKI